MGASREAFTIVKAASDLSPRLARLSLPGRAAIDTPHYLANTSRGVVPHLTQDTLARSTTISGVYVSLEDFIERAPLKTPPIYEYGSTNAAHTLRQFLAIPEDKILVLGARRTPPVVAPPATSNTDTAVAMSTSVGFRFVENDEYARRVETLGTDIIVGLADVPFGRALSAKRMELATDRSIEWVSSHLAERRQSSVRKSKYFASLLPVSCRNQQYYIDSLAGHVGDIDGLAIYGLDSLDDLPTQLAELPRIAYTEAATPLQALQHIQRGLDLLILPFIDVATDAGLALTFAFTNSDIPSQPLPLGEDLWDISHAIDLSPLSEGCDCYACTTHHRAYVQHLLSAKEMLGWVLLQIHNQHIVSMFFAAIRSSIADGTFGTVLETFSKKYDPELPRKTGQGPRVRGYQRRTEKAGEPKQNPRAYRPFNAEQLNHKKTPRSNAARITGVPDDLDLGLLEESPS